MLYIRETSLISTSSSYSELKRGVFTHLQIGRQIITYLHSVIQFKIEDTYLFLSLSNLQFKTTSVYTPCIIVLIFTRVPTYNNNTIVAAR